MAKKKQLKEEKSGKIEFLTRKNKKINSSICLAKGQSIYNA